jgi:hypothetical protein
LHISVLDIMIVARSDYQGVMTVEDVLNLISTYKNFHAHAKAWILGEAEDIYAGDVHWMTSASFRLRVGAYHLCCEQVAVYSTSMLANKFQMEVPNLWSLVMHLLNVDPKMKSGWWWGGDKLQ